MVGFGRLTIVLSILDVLSAAHRCSDNLNLRSNVSKQKKQQLTNQKMKKTILEMQGKPLDPPPKIEVFSLYFYKHQSTEAITRRRP